jgi:DNA repair photolyase
MPALRLGEVRVSTDGLTDRRTEGRELSVLDERLRGTKFVSYAARSVLNSPEQTGMGFWSLNPYVGCEFGCSYCYARYAHRYVVERAHDAGKLSDAEFRDFRGPHGWEAFERRIFVKQNVLAALDQDLRKFFRSAGPSARPPVPIALGTATDPYQPAERRFRLTRSILQRFERYEGLSIFIITKSPLVARDADVLERLSRRHTISVSVSLISVDEPLVRRLEVRSPTPHARLRGLTRLRQAGIRAGIMAAPVLPGITDDVSHLEALFQAAREAGAAFLHYAPLRLYGGIKDRFLPLIAEQFPSLLTRYRRAYQRRQDAPEAYRKALSLRIRKLREKYGIHSEDRSGSAEHQAGERMVQPELGL